jgi:hypothetical protein
VALTDGLPPTPQLTTIRSPKGVPFSVATPYAQPFLGLITDLENAGYPINAPTSGGYNRRVIAGTNTPSEHAFGRAIDVNWDQNPHGSATFSIPPDLAHQLSQKYGMTWGGDWQGGTKDAMHFQIANGQPVPMAPPNTVAPTPGSPPAVDTGPPAVAQPGAPGTNTGDVDLASVFKAHLQALQARQAMLGTAIAGQGQGMGFGLGQIDPAGPALQQVAQAFKGMSF